MNSESHYFWGFCMTRASYLVNDHARVLASLTGTAAAALLGRRLPKEA